MNAELNGTISSNLLILGTVGKTSFPAIYNVPTFKLSGILLPYEELD